MRGCFVTAGGLARISHAIPEYNCRRIAKAKGLRITEKLDAAQAEKITKSMRRTSKTLRRTLLK